VNKVFLHSFVLFSRHLVVANESRIIALDEVDEDALYRVCIQRFSLFISEVNKRN
jgi:hypothetical protein